METITNKYLRHSLRLLAKRTSDEKPIHKNGREYVVRSTLDPVTFSSKRKAKEFQALIRDSKRKIESEIFVVCYHDGYVEEEKVR